MRCIVKALIWIGCIFTLAILFVMIRNCGIILGGIPTVLMCGGMFWIAESLSKKCAAKKKDADSSNEESENDNKD